MYKANESGRSMVEMLGVLAIIGVLSVGGIAGYITAMNKHRANQILNGASVRAIVVSTQIQRGANIPTLGEFTDNEVGGATFGTAVKNASGEADWTTTDKRFSLTLTGVSTEICTQMKAAVGQNSIIREINDGCTTITYNNDLSPNDPAPTYDDNAGAKDCSSNADCDVGCQTCTDGKCISKCDLGAYCVQGPSLSDYVCVSVPTCSTNDDCSTGCCSNGVCTWAGRENTCSSETTKGCTNNGQCDAGEYCVTDSSCSTSITGGACTPLGTVHTVSGKTGNAATYNGWLYSDDSMTWWNATNWCKAQGKRLVSLSDLGISRPSGSSCSGSECIGVDWDVLKEAFGNGYFWANDSESSCSAFNIYTADQSVNTNGKPVGEFVLCR